MNIKKHRLQKLETYLIEKESRYDLSEMRLLLRVIHWVLWSATAPASLLLIDKHLCSLI